MIGDDKLVKTSTGNKMSTKLKGVTHNNNKSPTKERSKILFQLVRTSTTFRQIKDIYLQAQ